MRTPKPVNQVALHEYVNNIVTWYHRLNEFELEAGRKWYARAWEDIQVVAHKLNVDPVTLAAVVAVLSPRQKWVYNIQAASDVYHAWRMGFRVEDVHTHAFRANVAKGYRILDGEDPDEVVRGPKTNAFFHNLIGDESRVTVDSHAVGVAFDVRLVGVSVTKTQYRVLEQAYVEAADYINSHYLRRDEALKPYQLQAATWLAYRRYYIEEPGEAHTDL